MKLTTDQIYSATLCKIYNLKTMISYVFKKKTWKMDRAKLGKRSLSELSDYRHKKTLYEI